MISRLLALILILVIGMNPSFAEFIEGGETLEGVCVTEDGAEFFPEHFVVSFESRANKKAFRRSMRKRFKVKVKLNQKFSAGGDNFFVYALKARKELSCEKFNKILERLNASPKVKNAEPDFIARTL